MMASSLPAALDEDLDDVDIHGVLSNERRRMTLEILGEDDGSISARELSERIAERETGQQPPPRNIRQSAYVSLIQSHLPKLDELDIVEYESGSKTVTLSSSAEQVSTFMDSGSRSVLDEHYLLVAAVGVVGLLASKAGLVDVGLAGDFAILVFLVVAGVAVVGARADEWPLLTRIRNR